LHVNVVREKLRAWSGNLILHKEWEPCKKPQKWLNCHCLQMHILVEVKSHTHCSLVSRVYIYLPLCERAVRSVISQCSFFATLKYKILNAIDLRPW